MPLLNADEGRNASIAWEMQQNGHWLIPTYNGLPYLDKPAFFFKTIAFSFAIFGHTEWAARFPSAFFALMSLFSIFLFCKREYNATTALAAVVVVSTTPLFFAFARFVIFDMTLGFFIIAAIFSGYLAQTKTHFSKAWLLLAFACMGCATLVKGPVGLVIPLLVLVVFYISDGHLSAVKRLFTWSNGLIFLAVVLPWFLGVTYFRPDFPYYGLIRESFLRFFTPAFHRTHPFYFYLPVIMITALPWSILLPKTVATLWKNRKQLTRPDRLLFTFALVEIVFFSFSQSKLAGYVLTAVIALMVLVARTFSQLEIRSLKKSTLVFIIFYSLLAFGLLAYTHYIGWSNPKLIKNRALASLIESRVFMLAIFLSFSALLASFGLYFKKKWVVFSAYVANFITIFMISLPITAALGFLSDKNLVDAEFFRSKIPVVCYHCFPPGIIFYLQHPIILITDNHAAEMPSNYIPFMLSSLKEWPSNIQPIQSFPLFIEKQTAPFLLISKEKTIPLPIVMHAIPNTLYFEATITPRKKS